MNSSAIEVFKQLKLENDELKTLLLNLTAKYKTSEVKRTVLLRRNALLIKENRNLHKLWLETDKKRKVGETAAESYHNVLEHLKKELNQLKKEKLCGGDQKDVELRKNKSVSCFCLLVDKSAEENESVPYFEVSDFSTTNLSDEEDEEKTVTTGTHTSDGVINEEMLTTTDGTHQQAYILDSEGETSFQVADNIQIKGALTYEVPVKKDEKVISKGVTKEAEEQLFEQKRNRLWTRITELLEMMNASDKELETRRFAVAAKIEVVHNAQKEIRRLQKLLALIKQ